jgi:diguanylate cyclase (GGDEF)-like protein
MPLGSVCDGNLVILRSTDAGAGEEVNDMPKTSHVATAAAVVFAGFVALIVGGMSKGLTLKVVDDLIFVALTIPAAVMAGLAVRCASGRLRASWIAMTVGLVGWAFGEMLWAYYELAGDETPFPSLADAGYLVMPVGFCVALMLFPGEQSSQMRGRMLMDGINVAGSLFVVSWVTVLEPMYRAGADTTLALVISLAYPVSDVVILTIATIALIRARRDQRVVLTLLTVAMACIALSDSAFAYLSAENDYATGNVIDLGWVAGLLLIMVAAAASRNGEHHQSESVVVPGWASVWLPYAPLLLAGIVAANQPAETFRNTTFQVVGALLVVTLLGRQFIAVNENRRLLRTVAQQALHDPLTGLGNRAMFSERLNQAMKRREQEPIWVSLIALDLNDFKLVNDALGHAAGDELLSRVSERILGCVRNDDTVARLGGDEFVVLVEGDAEFALSVGQRVAESFDKPFVIEGRELFVRSSIGVATAGPGDPELNAEGLLRRADVAMYSAKKSRTATVHTFDPAMALTGSTDAALLNRLGEMPTPSEASVPPLLDELRRAIEQFELTLLYQPKIDLRTSRIVGVEALVRWPHPERGLLGPGEFLPTARRHNLMGPLTDVVLHIALNDALRFKAASVELPVAVNVSAPSFADPRLPALVSRALAERDLGSNALTLEITEDLMVLGNIDQTRNVLNQLRRDGIRIAIDDFGTGFSRLSYLCDLPVDEVKLDRRFVVSILNDHRVATVVRGIIGLAHDLQLTTVAEGVEVAALVAMLSDFGCDIVQGFYFCPPVTADEVIRLARFEATEREAALPGLLNRTANVGGS